MGQSVSAVLAGYVLALARLAATYLVMSKLFPSAD